MKETCGNCRFWRLNGECCRRSPRCERGPGGCMLTVFPYAGSDRWCGEWEGKKAPDRLDEILTDGEKCVRCGEVGQDRRTLVMSCGGDMQDPDPMTLHVPFQRLREPGKSTSKAPYTLRVCKQCRADWIAAIGQWFTEKKEGETDTTTAELHFDPEPESQGKIHFTLKWNDDWEEINDED